MLCIVCSVLVSGFAVFLRPIQEANKLLEQRKNVLLAAGMDADGLSKDQIEHAFDEGGRIEKVLIDLETGEPVSGGTVDAATYNQREAARKKDLSVPVEPPGALGGIQRREKYAFVYKVKNEEGVVDQVVLPVYGKGLWSTLYGFLSVDTDGTTVRGITFYEHKETPGLGGEVDNKKWKAGWQGKKLLGDDGQVALEVIKGTAPKDAEHEIDGLSGATLTANGVTRLVQYWIGDQGFKAFLDRFRQASGGGTDG